MLNYTRSVLFFSLAFGLAACAGAGQSGTTPSSGVSEALRTESGSAGVLVFKKASLRAEAGASPLLMNFVANGPAQSGVPCIDCVNGAGSSDNIGLTGPSSYVLSDATWQYAISFTDISYEGKCTVSWEIVSSAKKTIDHFSASFNLDSSGGFVIYAVNRGRPKYSGAATVTGKYACGKNSGSTKEPLYFQ
jgi:hypothetical protein